MALQSTTESARAEKRLTSPDLPVNAQPRATRLMRLFGAAPVDAVMGGEGLTK